MGELKCVGSERLVRLGISMTQLHMLHMLERHGELPMSRLAEMLDVSLSATRPAWSIAIEERGFVERIRVPSDRRIVLVRITVAGRPDARRRRDRCASGIDPARPRRARPDAQLAAVGRSHGATSGSPSRPRSRTTRPTHHAPPIPGEEIRPAHGSVPADATSEYVPTLEEDPALGLSHRAKMEILFAVMLGPVPRRPRPDHRRPGPADHRHPAVRQRLLRLGDHHLPADQHDQRPVLGQAVRPLRPQADLHDRHRHLPGRLGPVRPEPEHGHAHPLPRHPGHRRRLAVPGRPRGHR